MSKVFDCCMVFNELEMFDLRLNILNGAVDYHIIVESGMTHSGHPKPRYFGDALEAGRFAEFADKILYMYVETLGDAQTHSWQREHNHRAQISRALWNANVQPEDWVIVGDCDEIPNPKGIQAAHRSDAVAATMLLDLFYYDFSHRLYEGWSIGMAKWKFEQDANKIRRSEFKLPTVYAHERGWHLSYFMTPEQVVTKLDAFMHHGDVAANVPRDPVWIGDRMRAGLDLFGRTVEIVEVDPEPLLPQYVKDHRAQYEALGWLKPEKVTI